MDENTEKKPRKTRCDKGVPRNSAASVEYKLSVINAQIAKLERKAEAEAQLAAATAKLAEMLSVAHV